MYCIQHETRLALGNALFHIVGRAIANCFIKASSPGLAQQLAQKNFMDEKWQVVSLEDGPLWAERDDYLYDSE